MVKPTSSVQSLEERKEGQCRDYVQFYAGSFVSPRFCGDEMSEANKFKLSVNATDMLAVFWSDWSRHAPGFMLKVTCDEETLSRD